MPVQPYTQQGLPGYFHHEEFHGKRAASAGTISDALLQKSDPLDSTDEIGTPGAGYEYRILSIEYSGDVDIDLEIKNGTGATDVLTKRFMAAGGAARFFPLPGKRCGPDKQIYINATAVGGGAFTGRIEVFGVRVLKKGDAPVRTE